MGHRDRSSASTRLPDDLPFDVPEASTDIPHTPTKSGAMMAKIVLGAAMFASENAFTAKGFRDGLATPYVIESSTAIRDIDPQLKQQVRKLWTCPHF